jgi:hypothetical protein
VLASLKFAVPFTITCKKNDGIWFEDTLYGCPLESVQPVGTRGSARGIAVMDYFAKYFTSPQGSIPWQYSKI